MDFLLAPAEVRVLGSLLEKDITTPEYYPLTMNALLNACNQRSNRDPVVHYDEDAISIALDTLRNKGFIVNITGGSNRVTKFAHRIGDRLNLGRRELAVLCELMLRGAQTPGELRQRASRFYEFDDLEEVETVLRTLMERQPGSAGSPTAAPPRCPRGTVRAPSVRAASPRCTCGHTHRRRPCACRIYRRRPAERPRVRGPGPSCRGQRPEDPVRGFSAAVRIIMSDDLRKVFVDPSGEAGKAAGDSRRTVRVRRVDECESMDEIFRHCLPAFGGAYLRRLYTILDTAIGMGCPLTVSIAGPVTVSGQHQTWLIPLLETGWVAYLVDDRRRVLSRRTSVAGRTPRVHPRSSDLWRRCGLAGRAHHPCDGYGVR